jgi:FKBP-type peptidyl-prolyl cis-trans isomerase
MKPFLFISLFILLFSCNSNSPKKEIAWDKNKSIEMNKRIAQKEQLDIAMYLEHRKGLDMKRSGSGLYYCVYKKSEGDTARTGMEAGVRYTISFLNGDTCYVTPKDEIVYFKIDKTDIESGVQEGIKKMKLGEKAILIIPSHLAHGITGDNNKIPPITPLVVDIELLKLFK